MTRRWPWPRPYCPERDSPHLPAAARPTPAPWPLPGNGRGEGGGLLYMHDLLHFVSSHAHPSVRVSWHVDIFVIRKTTFASRGRALKFEGQPRRLWTRDAEILKQLIVTTTRSLQCPLLELKVDLDPKEPLTETKEESRDSSACGSSSGVRRASCTPESNESARKCAHAGCSWWRMTLPGYPVDLPSRDCHHAACLSRPLLRPRKVCTVGGESK